MKRQPEAYAYEFVAADLLRRINEGEWRQGERLPTLRQLEQSYPQSRMTLYKSLQRLQELGHIRMQRGRGTFVLHARPRLRIAVLTSSALFRQSHVPFAFQAFRHAHAFFTRIGLDAQLYAEDDLAESGLPSGLLHELERRKLAGLFLIDARFPARFMKTDAWKRLAIPVVNLGAAPAPHTVYVDRVAFLDAAVALAARQGRSRLALAERAEHLSDHIAAFQNACRRHGLTPCPFPSYMPSPELSYEEYGFDLMHRFWNGNPRPDAILVPDDVIAKGVSQAALALGPAGASDTLILAMTNRGSRFFYPSPITRFEVDVESLVNRAARLLTDMISGLAVPPRTLLIPPLSPDTGEPALEPVVRPPAATRQKQGAERKT